MMTSVFPAPFHRTESRGFIVSPINRRELIQSGLALSAATLASRSALARALAADVTLPTSSQLSAAQLSAIAPRERLLFDFGWKFFLGNGADPSKDLGFGNGQGDFAKTGSFRFATVKFDDSSWRDLNLPHDWAVELPFVDDPILDGHGYKPLGRRYPETSVGWYRRTFPIPATDLGRRISVEFDGAFRSALVFVNGIFVGRNDNGYAPFTFDISDFLNYGDTNCITVRMDASFGDGWFYEGAGLYRHIWLTKTDALHLGQWDSFVRADLENNSATLSTGTVVVNQGTQPETVRVNWNFSDPAGNHVGGSVSAPQTIDPLASATFTITGAPILKRPIFWSLDSPYLYTATITIETDGKVRDAERIQFGIRSIRFDSDKGFFLNGNSVKIKGTCNHQDHAGVGAALPDGLQTYRVSVLKQMGSNAVRTSHNMPTPEWVDACDRMGMMMMCETRQMNSSPEGLAQLEKMIKRYRNSPSIILWSVGNEEGSLQRSDIGERVTRSMVSLAHQLDPTRLCTEADNGGYDIGVVKAIDVTGFNYGLAANSPDKYHTAHPTQPCIGTETASTVSTRGVYITDKLRNWLSAYDLNTPPWAETAENWWKYYAARDWLAGGFAWTGFDYRGEPTPYSWPSINSQFGIVDMCGFPKDNYFYYKAWWGTQPVLHLFPHWNWDERLGEPIEVWVHSNLDSVELFLNGKSLGSQQVQPLTHLRWMVPYSPGVLEARGSKSGKVEIIAKRETTGTPASIQLTADRTQIDANGEDIAIVRVEVLDSAGRSIPTADNFINFKITGEAALLGVGNGDPNCQESDKQPQRSLFNGLAQVILQSTAKPGAITLEATTRVNSAQGPPTPPTLLTASLTIQTSNVQPRPAVPSS
jgi:beta-galactosidase